MRRSAQGRGHRSRAGSHASVRPPCRGRRAWESHRRFRNIERTMELRIDHAVVARARSLAAAIVEPVHQFIAAHSTASVERAVLRLLGIDGVAGEDIPLPNAVLDTLSPAARAAGIARWIGGAVAEIGESPAALAARFAAGEVDLHSFGGVPEAAARGALAPYVEAGLARVAARRTERRHLLTRLPQSPAPLLYVIVASG